MLIFSVLLSFLSGGRTEEVSAVSAVTHNRDICIIAAQGYTFAGSDSTNSVSVKTAQSGRRVNPQVRSTFRIVKCGKVINNNHLHPFLAQSVVHLAGIYISERYLFSICRLRL
ncbi:MAG: hypothetical protein J6O51_02130 [Bacteroidales bacterium]|nr:hypothetical protein [Bacteroidales bacterium]